MFSESFLRIWSHPLVSFFTINFDQLGSTVFKLDLSCHLVESNSGNAHANRDLESLGVFLVVYIPLGLENHAVETDKLDPNSNLLLKLPGPVYLRQTVENLNLKLLKFQCQLIHLDKVIHEERNIIGTHIKDRLVDLEIGWLLLWQLLELNFRWLFLILEPDEAKKEHNRPNKG